MASSGSGISFGFAQPKSARATVENTFDTNEENGADEKRDFVTSLEGNTINSTLAKQEKKVLVIPCIDGTAPQPTPAVLVEQNGGPTPAADTREKTLDELAAEALMREAHGVMSAPTQENATAIPLLMRNRLPGLENAKNEEEAFKLDVEQRPDEASLDAYDATPVDQFGAAMLRGMGWSEGEAIGGINKGLIQPIEFVARPLGLGLGAQRDADMMPTHKKKKFIKPGESRDPKGPTGPMVDASGRVRHVKGIDEKLTQQAKLSIVRDAYVEITGGPHEGHLGRVRRVGSEFVEVELAVGNATVSVPENMLTPLHKPEYKEKLKEPRREKEKSKHHHEKDRSDRDKHDDRKTKHDGSGVHGEAKRTKREVGNTHVLGPTVQSWLRRNLRVRIVSEKYKGGAYYNKKVVINDVLAPGECVCVTDSGSYLEGLTERDLETLIPHNEGATIMVVRGEHKGTRGKLMQRLLDKERVVVQLMGDPDVEQFSLDDVCEYVGEKTIEDW